MGMLGVKVDGWWRMTRSALQTEGANAPSHVIRPTLGPCVGTRVRNVVTIMATLRFLADWLDGADSG